MKIEKESTKPVIGISACLTGESVRYNGGHKHSKLLMLEFDGLVHLNPICPEVSAGLSVPRPTLHLRMSEKGIRLTESKDGSRDVTESVTMEANRFIEQHMDHICGFIFQQKSPSCGLHRVKLAAANGNHMDNSGTGVFAAQIAKNSPLVPLEEEGRLHDHGLRENFIERVFALHRWREIDPKNVEEFIDFHSTHKLMLMARGSTHYKRLGNLVAGVSRSDLAARRDAYITDFMATLAIMVPRRRHVNVLQHIMGFLKKQLDAEDKIELLNSMDAYKARQVPLCTPIALLKHHLRKLPDSFIARQHYLSPYPEAFGLRAHV